MRKGATPATVCAVTNPADETVPRDPVWQYVRQYGLPRQETIRMAGGPEGAVGLYPRNKRATISRTAAIRLLGEAEVDARWPRWGEHRAAVASVPGARTHYGAFPWCRSTFTLGASGHDYLVRKHGTVALTRALAT